MFTLKDVIGSDHRNDAMHFLQLKQQVWSDIVNLAHGNEGSDSAHVIMSYVTTAANGLSIWKWLGLDHIAATIAHIGGIGAFIFLSALLCFVVRWCQKKLVDNCCC
jgi:hypothetical protein